MKRQWKTGLVLVFAVLATVVFSLLSHAPVVSAANPQTISFQGKVVNADGTNVADGSYSFLFKLYSGGTESGGGTQVWTETRTINVVAGVFQIDLGGSCSFFTPATCNGNTAINFSTVSPLYLGMTFNSDPNGEMLPRVQLQSVPFAFNSDRVGGFTADQLVQLSPGSAQSGFVNVTGAGSFGGNITGSGTLTINGTGTSTISGNLLVGAASSKAFIGDVGWSGSGFSGGFASTAANATQTRYALLQADNGLVTLLNAAATGQVVLAIGNTTVLTISSTGAAATGTLSATGTISSSGGNINATAGTIQTAATDRISNGGNLVNIGTITAAGGDYNVNATGDQTAVFTLLDGTTTTNGTSGLGSSTNLILTSAASFDVGNYVQVNDTNCGGTGVNPCYAKITAKNTNTLTISPALTWTSGKSVKEYHIPEIGGTDLTKTLANRYGMGYFIGGVATGNGTTYYSEDGITSSLNTFNFLTPDINGTVPTTINIGGTGTTAINIGVTGTVTTFAGGIATSPGQAVDAGTGALKGGSLNINSGAFAVNSAGAITASTGIANSGGYVQSGGTTNTFTGLVQDSAGLTVTGTTTLASLTTAGVLHTTAGTGVLTTSAVVLGTETSGSYVAALGTGTGVTIGSNSGAGSNPTISVNYGAAANTAVQGNVQITCPSGTGNLSGTGNAITLGSGGTCAALDTKAAVSFGTSVTTPVITSTAGLGIDSAASNGITIGATNATTVTIGNATTNPTISFSGSGTFATTSGAVSLNGNTTVTGTKTLTVSGGLTSLGGGLNVTGGNVNASTGTVQTGGTDRISNGGNLINIGTVSAAGGTFTINGTGAITASTGIAISGGYTQTGVVANLLSGATTFSAAGTALTVNNNALISGTGTIGTLSVTNGATVGNGLTVSAGGAGITGNATITGGNVIVQQTGAGASLMLNRTDGVVGSLKAGSAKVAFFFDDSGSFAISKDTRANILAGTSAGTDVLTISNTGNLVSAGSIAATTTVTGTSIIGNTGINTGASAGTQRIDASGNLVNIGNYTSTAGSTFTTTGANGFTFKPGTNNSTAFEIQRADGTPLVLVDTTTVNLLTNPGFELGTTGWSARGTSAVSQNTNTTFTYHGIASLKAVVTAANSGVTTNSFTQTITPGTYTLSFYAESTSAIATLRAGYNQGAETACITTGASIITGFVRYSCTFTTTSNLVSIFIDAGASTSNTLYIDAVQLQTGSVATAYQIGSEQFRGVITNPLSLQSSSNSTTALQVQNAAGTSTTFAVDTVNGRANVSTAFSVAGVAGSTVAACSASQYLGAAKLTGGILTAGTCTNDATGLSDVRLKTNIVELGSALDAVKHVKTYTFNYKCDDPEYASLNLSCDLQTGVIAQELQQYFPNLVSQRDDGYYQVDYRGLSVETLNAVGELARNVDALSAGTVSSGAIIASSLTANGGLIINSGTSGDVALDTGGTSAVVKIGAQNAAGVSISHAGAVTDVAGALTVDGATTLAGPVTMDFAEAEHLKLGKDLHIDNSSADTAVDSAIKVSNTGGAGFTNIISTDNFTVTGSGDVLAKNFTGKNGSFQLLDASGANVVTIDGGGNATFKGDLNLNNAALSGGLTVGGDVTIAGLSTFQKLATFIGKTIFRQDVQFDGHLTVAKDGAGYATLRATESTVHVKFHDDYATPPVVSAAITNGKFAAYSIDHVDQHGFDITLKDPAAEDTVFSWTAIGVNDPQTASNPVPTTP